MDNNRLPNQKAFSLLVVVVNRGKGSKVLEFAAEHGAVDASCLLGKGTVRNKLLKFMELDEAEREIILIVMPADKSAELLGLLNQKFKFDKPHHGIAFVLPLIGMLKIKCDSQIQRGRDLEILSESCPYTALFTIVDKDKGQNVVKISQDAGFYGGTIIKARGTSDKVNIVLDMVVEPEKEMVFTVLKKDRANRLAAILNEQLSLNKPNKGFLVKLGVSDIVGLFSDGEEGQGE